MALYAIADLHLSLASDKPMDVFGGAWEGYVDKLREGLSVIGPDDTTVLPGDLSWALSLDEAEADFAFMSAIPGRKIILKGNHDYWWSTAKKFEDFCVRHGFENMHVLNNNCFFYGETALCGTRGWFFEEERGDGHDEKVFRRELGRLETSLKAAGKHEKLCFLHYPPKYRGYECREILDLMASYGVSECYYGHLHGASHRLAVQGDGMGLSLHMVSADYLGFRPLKIRD